MGAIALAALLPGCIDIPDDSKTLLKTFVVLLGINIFLQLVVVALILFYFLPFTRPRRKRRR